MIDFRKLGDIRTGLICFPMRFDATPNELTAAWRACGLNDLLGPKEWSDRVTIHRTEPIHEAIYRLSCRFDFGNVKPDNLHRGAVLIPDGRYELTEELNLGDTPYFDLIGESKEETILTYGGSDNAATIWLNGSSCLLAHLTVERTGKFTPPTGYGVQYAVHDNGMGSGPREVLLVDLDCKTTPEVGSNGIGTGFGNGGLTIYCDVNADYGFFCHNADDVREEWEHKTPRRAQRSPATMIYLNCTAGLNPPVSPGSALRHWNLGSGQPDRLVLYGGQYHGLQRGVEIIDFGLPFHGASETELYLAGDVAPSGSVIPLAAPKETIVRRP